MANKKYTAKLKRIQVSSQKARLVTRALSGKTVTDARSFLEFSDYKISGMIKGLLESAVANASTTGVSEDSLILYEVRADEGPTQKGKGLFGSRGRFKPRKSRTSHITLTLMEIAKANNKKEVSSQKGDKDE